VNWLSACSLIPNQGLLVLVVDRASCSLGESLDSVVGSAREGLVAGGERGLPPFTFMVPPPFLFL